MKFNSLIPLAIAACVGMVMPDAARAATPTSFMAVSATVVDVCTIAAQTTYRDRNAALAAKAGIVNVSCTKNTDYTLRTDSGTGDDAVITPSVTGLDGNSAHGDLVTATVTY